jgi:hypothetical protein
MVIFQVSVSNNGLSRTFYPLPRSLLIGRCLRLGTGQRVECQWTCAPLLRQVNAPEQGPHSSGIPALRSPAKKVVSNKARILATPEIGRRPSG